MRQEINLEPNYKNLFAQFLREAQLQGEIAARSDKLEEVQPVREVIVALGIALGSMTDTNELEELRKVVGDLSTKLAARADQLRDQRRRRRRSGQLAGE
jgi:hypothetical protein